MREGTSPWLALVISGLVTACATPPPVATPHVETKLVFPAPPDEPRIVYERTIYGTADVVKKSSSADFQRFVTGDIPGGEGLGKPYAVAVWRGKVFVSDSAERYVRVFDVRAGKHYRIGEGDQGRLFKPLGIDVDDKGNLYVADATQKVVAVFDADGKFKTNIGSAMWFDRLSSVTVDRAGSRVYVTDIGGVGSENHRIRVFDANSGKHLLDIGRRGTGPGELNLPRDVAIGKDGRIYVVDGGNFRIQVFEPDGTFVRNFGSVGKQFGQFARPKEIATDSAGNVYVVDAAFGNFQIFSAGGDLLLFVGQRSERDGPARYMLPSGIAVDEDGRIYVVDQWFRKIDVFRPNALGEHQGYLTPSSPERNTPQK